MNGFQAYRYYLGTKLHFTSMSYDVIDMNCRVSAGQTAYNKRRDKWMFEKLAEQIPEPRYLIRYLVANFAYGHSNVLYDREVGMDMESQWIKTKESLSRVFEMDLEKILEYRDQNKISSDEIFNCTEKGICSIIKLYKQDLIHLESVALILELRPELLDNWLEFPECKMIYSKDILRMAKVRSFVKNSERTKKVWNNFLEDV